MTNKHQQAWEAYVREELDYFTPLLHEKGYTLNEHQPQVQGERYLMQAITTTSGKKVILFGGTKDGMKVVIKASTDPHGRKEIEHERASRELLQRIKFAYNVFFSPQELLYEKTAAHTIFIQEFIEQSSPFIERPLEEQFTLALKAFKAQEGARATTYEHEKIVRDAFSYADAAFYLEQFICFIDSIKASYDDQKLFALLEETLAYLTQHAALMDQYRGFLTHTDFVPHNIRIKDDVIYLLDHSSLRFGNKYEGWARFLNFMTLYSPKLEDACLYYLTENRIEAELQSLKLMRLYRLGEILWFYIQNLPRTEGNLHTLTKKRILFWSEVLDALLHDEKLPEGTRAAYIQDRDALRSEDEKQRQKNLH